MFGEATWHILSRLDVTAGACYTYEGKDGAYDVRAFGGLEEGLTSAQTTDRNAILRSQSYTAQLSDGSVSGRANLAYRLMYNVMAYAGLARPKIRRDQYARLAGLSRRGGGTGVRNTHFVYAGG